MTPEGKVKAAVSKLLAKHKTYTFMPVPGGYGISSLDYIVCHRGRFLAIETKAPGKKPTPRQVMIAEKIRAAGGTVFVIDNVKGLAPLEAYLASNNADDSSDLHEAQDGGGALPT